MKKIVFLDRDHFQKAHESFDYSSWHALGDFSYFDKTNEDDIIERVQDADVVVLLKTALPSHIISQMKKTKLICKVGTGYDRIAVKTAAEQGIVVTNFPGFASDMVAQWTISLMLALAGSILPYERAVRDNRWLASQFSYPMTCVIDKTLGIIGYGLIGKRVASMAMGLGMRVLVSTQFPDQSPGVSFVDKKFIYQHADFISLHGLLTDETRNMINDAVFAMMKPTSYLINTSRAGFINKEALLKALQEKIIAGAALDGFWKEPPDHDESLFALDNVIVTPHIGWVSGETRQAIIQAIGDRIGDFFAGKKIRAVN